MQFLLGKGIVTCCPCPKYWWVGEANICAWMYIEMFGMDKGLGVFKVVFEVERLIGVDEWWMSNTWIRSISLTSQIFIYPLVSTPIFLHGKNLFWWHSLLQKRFNLLMSEEVLFDSFKCFLLQESPLHVHHLVKVLETLQSLLFACSGLSHAHVCASEDPSGAPKGWRWWKVVKEFSYRNRGKVQPKSHGEMLDPFGRLVSMTGKMDHLTCQDAHLQCMEAQWQRARCKVIYRSQNHSNLVGRKRGGLYVHQLQYPWLFRLYTYTQERRSCIDLLHACIYACVDDTCSILQNDSILIQLKTKN